MVGDCISRSSFDFVTMSLLVVVPITDEVGVCQLPILILPLEMVDLSIGILELLEPHRDLVKTKFACSFPTAMSGNDPIGRPVLSIVELTRRVNDLNGIGFVKAMLPNALDEFRYIIQLSVEVRVLRMHGQARRVHLRRHR